MQKNDSDNFWLHKGGCLWIGETICICLILSFCHQNQFSKSLVSLDMLLVDFSMTREKPQKMQHTLKLFHQIASKVRSMYKIWSLSLKVLNYYQDYYFLNYYFFTTIIPLKLLTGKQTGVADC